MEKPRSSSGHKRLALIFSFLLSALFSAGVQYSRAAEEPIKIPDFPISLLNNLPMMYRSKNNLGESSLYRMRTEDCLITHEGKHYIGFQFWSPQLPKGSTEWLIASARGSDISGEWQVIDSNGNIVARCQPDIKPLEQYPRVVERYPSTTKIAHYLTDPSLIEKRTHYYLIQPVADKSNHFFGMSFTSQSKAALEEFGQLAPEVQKLHDRSSSDVVVEEMKELRREKSIEAAMDYLRKELELRMDDLEFDGKGKERARFLSAWHGYRYLFVSTYLEGQQGGGRESSLWSSNIFDTLFKTTHQRQYYDDMMDVSSILMSKLNSSGRYGRLAEVFAIWSEGMRMGGYRMDIKTYPDMGPAFPFLEKVHKRNMPALIPYSLLKKGQNGVQQVPKELTYNHIGGIRSYADMLWRNGEWQESLEWILWCKKWASNPEDGGPDKDLSPTWQGCISELSWRLEELGFIEETLSILDTGLNAKYDGYYLGRSTVSHKLTKIRISMDLNQSAPPDLIDQIKQIIEQSRGNIYVSEGTVTDARTILACAMIYTGDIIGGESLLDELVESGSGYARSKRLVYWMKNNKGTHVEEEFITLLNESRKAGNKLEEVWLYSLYADFLEKQNRSKEALMVRRETIRLYRIFDLYTKLPVELAKLSALLEKIGARNESLAVEKEAKDLFLTHQLPARYVEQAQSIIRGIVRGEHLKEKDTSHALVEFQPQRAVVIPIQNKSWSTLLTLSNLSEEINKGQLTAVGMPVNIKPIDGTLDIMVAVGAKDGSNTIAMDLSPGTYNIIEVSSDAGKNLSGALALTYKSNTGSSETTCNISIENTQNATNSTIIQAGQYQLNPFYGVPIYHQYVSTDSSTHTKPLRFITSEPSRVEIYQMDGTAAAVDGQGNGSLQDGGDELFGNSDDHGHLLLPIAENRTFMMILVYPNKTPPENGLSLRIEALEEDKWTLYSEDLILPPATKTK